MSDAKAYTDEERAKNVEIWTLESLGDGSTLMESLVVQKVMRYEVTLAELQARFEEMERDRDALQEEVNEMRYELEARAS